MAAIRSYAVIYLTVIVVITAHPQCLDFRPPFKSAEQLDFCSEYTEFGCCSPLQDHNLAERYKDITSRLGSRLSSQCRQYVQQILCQECSPYAAHIYDAEETQQIAPFPGLCLGYCQQFYSECNIAIPELTDDPTILNSRFSQDAFCIKIEIGDPSYCYPDLLTNSELQEGIRENQETVEGCLCLEELASGLRNPLVMRTPDDATGRLFIGEQVGVVHIYYKNGSRISDPFLDIETLVLTSSRSGDERGFLGLAFHPDFKHNRKLYVYFSLSANGEHKTRLSQFLVDANNPNKVDRNSEKVILEVSQPYWNHNGGELMFGVDGYLYLFLGDGGAGGDPQNYAQNKNVLLGKALRLDINVPEGETDPYLIPPDNPFVDEAGARPEIYAYGIRNIWRCDVDEGDPETGYGYGRIFCGDVGQSAFEEIDIIEKGGNYGWNAREGNACYRTDLCGKIGEEVLPIYDYPHSVGKSVTGGHVYRGCLSPNLKGQYIYGDYVHGKLFSLAEDRSTNTWQNREITMCEQDMCFNGLVGSYEPNILSFGEDDDGEVYMLTTDNPSPTAVRGKVYKIVDPWVRGDPSECRSNKPSSVSTTSTASTTTATTTTEFNPCIPNPCLNGGYCDRSENPWRLGFMCNCGRDVGGRRCQIRDPCNTVPCPAGTDFCLYSTATDRGRFCYQFFPSVRLLD